MTRCCPLLVLGLGLLSAAPAAADGGIAAYLLQFTGEYVAGKGIDAAYDYATGKPDVRELDKQLKSLQKAVENQEKALGKSDLDVTRRVEQMRRELNERTSPEQVRALVRGALRDLDEEVRRREEAIRGRMKGFEENVAGQIRGFEGRVGGQIRGFEGRVEKVEDRVKQLEEIFTFIPQLPPTPTAFGAAEAGRPRAHPLLAEWADILVRSESNRLQIARLRETYRDDAPQVRAALDEETRLRDAAYALYQKAQREVAERLPEREELLKTRKLNHPDVLQFDNSLACLLWLCGVCRPQSGGEHAGRLAVPADLVGPRCSEIVVAFEASKGDPKALVPLFRQLLGVSMTATTVGPSAVRADRLPPGMGELIVECDRFLGLAAGARRRAAALQIRIDLARRQHSDVAPEVAALLASAREKQAELFRLHDEGESLLARALGKYIDWLRIDRATTPWMVGFRQAQLKALAGFCDLSACGNRSNPIDVRATWDRFQDRPGHAGVERALPGLRLEVRAQHQQVLDRLYLPEITAQDVAQLLSEAQLILAGYSGADGARIEAIRDELEAFRRKGIELDGRVGNHLVRSAKPWVDRAKNVVVPQYMAEYHAAGAIPTEVPPIDPALNPVTRGRR